MLETKPHIVSRKITLAMDLLNQVKDILDQVYGDDNAVARDMHDDIEHVSDILMGDLMMADERLAELVRAAEAAALAAGGRFKINL